MKKRVIYSLIPPLLFIFIIWCIHILQWGLEIPFYKWGIYPRSLSGLKGIIFSPLIHSNFKHLLANTPALLVLGWFLYYFYKTIANSVFICCWLISGFLTWIFGRESYHIGASGIIYALAFYLFFSGLFRKNTRLSAVALITVFIYGSMVWNMLPIAEIADPKTSWEGHLAGAMAGFISSLIFIKKGPQPDPVPEDLDDDDDVGYDYHLPDDKPENKEE